MLDSIRYFFDSLGYSVRAHADKIVAQTEHAYIMAEFAQELRIELTRMHKLLLENGIDPYE